MQDSRELLAEAANVLIDDDDAPEMYKKLLWVHDVARKGVPVRLTGRPSVLNPILDLMLTDFPKAERVIQLIERKRAESHMDPLIEAFNRRSYMRELMASKRERESRLLKLVNQLRSEHDKIRGLAALEFKRTHGNRWHAVRLERESAMRSSVGRRLTIEELDTLRSQLWADVDSELNDLENFVREELRKPLQLRAPNGFNFRIQPKKEANDGHQHHTS